jgi:acetylornithine/succinyldiaminopimelate/putrescine aminotransferase
MELTKLDQIRAAEARLLLSTYDRNPILFVGGEGVHIIDEKGERYLDLLSGIGVNALGYGHPAILEAVARQSRALITPPTSTITRDKQNSRYALPSAPAWTAPSLPTLAPRLGKVLSSSRAHMPAFCAVKA